VGLKDVGTDPGGRLADALGAAWRDAAARIPKGACLHVMFDQNDEEAYHSRYMRDMAHKAGIRTKLVQGLGDLCWGSADAVVDADGEEVKFVWKTWAWETVFEDLSRTQLSSSKRAAAPTLSDVLLRDGITVWEPLWTTIMNNKAILPVLSQMFPGHPLLLHAELELSAALRLSESGYVTKPIVGRSGSNVTLFAPGGSGVVEKLGGKFSEKDVVYQEAFALPRIGGTSVLLCLWVVQGRCAGFVVRV
jgi:glutathionylspermidine amidase/synthetase